VLPASLPIIVVHNAIDVDRFVADGPALDLDSLSGLPAAPAGTVRIGMPATFARWKGQDIFLDAAARLARPGVRAYIIGDALYQTRNSQWSRAELQSAVQRLGLSGRVGFTGSVADMAAAYRALDIVVHASTRPEPFGLVIAEAMACGRALIAAPAGGAGELFVDGVHALAVPGGDAPGLAAAIDRLISDPLRRKTLGAAAREHAARAFSRERFGRELRAALDRVAMGAAALAVAL
jgi:glycosyltransferase involved in cell wall biosynthesis